MSKFATKLVDEIKAKEVVEQLVIDDVGQLDNLENQLANSKDCLRLFNILQMVVTRAKKSNI